MVATGLLSGKGTFDPTFLTVVGSGGCTGRPATIGTFTVKSDMMMASASALLIDAQRGRADKLARGGRYSDGTGVLTLSQKRQRMPSRRSCSTRIGAAPRAGESYVIASAPGGMTGTFGTSTRSRACFGRELTYGANTITATLRAGSLVTILDGQNPTALAFANALDQLRTGFYDKLWNLYGNVDWMNGAQLSCDVQRVVSGECVGETPASAGSPEPSAVRKRQRPAVAARHRQAHGLQLQRRRGGLANGQRTSPQAVLGLQSGASAGIDVPMRRAQRVRDDGRRRCPLELWRLAPGSTAASHSRYFASGLEAPFGDVMVGTAVGYAEFDTHGRRRQRHVRS